MGKQMNDQKESIKLNIRNPNKEFPADIKIYDFFLLCMMKWSEIYGCKLQVA